MGGDQTAESLFIVDPPNDQVVLELKTADAKLIAEGKGFSVNYAVSTDEDLLEKYEEDPYTNFPTKGFFSMANDMFLLEIDGMDGESTVLSKAESYPEAEPELTNEEKLAKRKEALAKSLKPYYIEKLG